MASGASRSTGEHPGWRNDLMAQLQRRNRVETYGYCDLISLHNCLFENVDTLRAENLQLSISNERLRNENVIGGAGASGNAALESKLLSQAEELATLHKRRGEHAQQIVDLNNKLQELTKELQSKDATLTETLETNKKLRAEIGKYETRQRELHEASQTLQDEHQALHLAFVSLENKLRKTQEENSQLVERFIKYKKKDADKMNEENDIFVKKRQARMQKELEDAARDTRQLSPGRIQS